MNDPLGAVVARISALDSAIRSLDPDWTGSSFGAFLDTVAGTQDVSGAIVGGSASIGMAGSASVARAPVLASAGLPAGLGLVNPLPGGSLTQSFGPSDVAEEPPATVDGVSYAHYHTGLDLAAPLGTPVRAAADGVVELAGRVPDGAVDVRIRHVDGSATLYGHLRPDLAVVAGQAVRAGQVLGAVGMTGNTTGPHLHFALYVGDRPIDPAPWLGAGRLPGGATIDADAGLSSDALARFDRVADDIPYAPEIRSAALAAGVDPLLLASLTRAESGFRPEAVSSAGAMGMTQLMPATAKALKVTDPFDPATNLAGGAKYLASDLKLYGRVDLALAAYQAGKGSVARAGGIPDSPTTHHYIDRVLGYWSGYLQEAGA